MQAVKDFLRLKYAPPERKESSLGHLSKSISVSALPSDGLALQHWTSMAPTWQRIIDATSDKWHLRLTQMVRGLDMRLLSCAWYAPDAASPPPPSCTLHISSSSSSP